MHCVVSHLLHINYIDIESLLVLDNHNLLLFVHMYIVQHSQEYQMYNIL